ncbi:clathrin light chain A-like [Lytechinus pictus]|uniref:clathrin light chain A-like n=1 Tax=Lytechinus pictus TaxID=7653 RepID=UPI00240D44D5|nr:clathrin light chain A-like [Lytechinus pictus]XP_054775457.1 clathrin light chain A-like [Lytechinus pictus]
MGGDMESEKPADDMQTNGPTDLYSAISHADTRANEPEKIRLWREEQKNILAKKDEEADELELDWKESAKKEITDWYARQAEQLVKAKASNRAAEEAFIEKRDEVTPGQEWERIAGHCDFNPKNNKNLKDITRFRSILLHLKQSGVQPSK